MMLASPSPRTERVTPFFRNWRCLSGLTLVVIVHWVWEAFNDTPPIWDMAHHQLMGWLYLDAFREGRLLAEFASISSSYPPLYYLQEALVFHFFPESDLQIQLVNLPVLVVTAWATYKIAVYYLSPSQASWAATVSLAFPAVAMVHREALLDGLLSAWVVVALWLVLRSDLFQNRSWSIVFGVVCGLGMLTKWTFPVYVCLPALFALWASPQRGRSILNLVCAGLAALPLFLSYYLPNLAALLSRYPTTNQTGLIPWQPYPRHGEPGLNNVLGWIYYPRVVASYFLYLPLTVLFLWGWWRSRRAGQGSRPSPALLWVWLVSILVLLIFVTPKDPRFALPVAAPLAILLFYFWQDRPRVGVSMTAIAVFQLVAFSWPLFGPVKIALFELKGDRDYQSLQREWVLFSNHYFGLVGPPVVEDWKAREIVESLPDGSRVGVLPSLARFHYGALQLEAVRKKRRLSFLDFGEHPAWAESLARLDFVVAKTGHQGISFITRYNTEIGQSIRRAGWTLEGRWELPDAAVAEVWKKPSRAPTQGDQE